MVRRLRRLRSKLLLVALLVCVAGPARAAEVTGMVKRADDDSGAVEQPGPRRLQITRITVDAGQGGEVQFEVIDGSTQIAHGDAPGASAELVAGTRVHAVMADPGCKLEESACVAARVEILGGGVRSLDAKRVQSDSEKALAELPPGTPGSSDPGMDQLGAGSGAGGRERSEELGSVAGPARCPEGMVPLLKGTQVVLGLDGEPACRVKVKFVKGELTNLGSSKLVVNDSRFGLRIGYARLDNSSYLAISPEIDLRFSNGFAIGLGVPLNIRAYAGGFVDGQGVHLRPHDYDKPSDFARILRFLTYGKKEDQLYLNISQLFAASIGHGAIVRRFSGNTDQNFTRVGAELDAYGRFGGFEAFVGDIVQPNHFLAGLAFVKPLGFIDGPLRDTLGQTSLGLSTAMDLEAPYTLTRVAGYPQSTDDGEPQVAETRRAQIVGLDLETKLVKTDGVDLKPFVDYSRMLGIDNPTGPGARADGGGGLTLGMLGRFTAGEVRPHAFRVIVEGRYFDGNYLPGYFDTFYEVQKYQFITGRADLGYQPKLRTLLGRDPAQKRAGYYAEAAYQYNGGLALMVAFEDSAQVAGPDAASPTCGSGQPCLSNGTPAGLGSRNLTLHLEYPAYSWLQFFASFYRRSFDGAPLSTDHPLGDNTLVYAALRLHLLPILFLNARIYRSWQADPALGEMRNSWGGDADLELGYEFNRPRP